MELDVLQANQPRDKTSKEPVGWTVWDAIGVLVVWLVFQGVAAAAVFALRLQIDNPLVSTGLLCAFPILLTALTIVWVRGKGAGALSQLNGGHRPTLRDAIAGIFYGLVGAVLITFVVGEGLRLLLRFFGLELPPMQEELRELVTSQAAPLAIVAITGLAPIAEELFFRGMLFQSLQSRFTFWPAATASGIVFGLVHAHPLVTVVTAVLGVYLAWIFRRHGTILVPILAHAIFNTLGVVLIRAGLG
jgi:membrane protease YdiL (CAAX protease family)